LIYRVCAICFYTLVSILDPFFLENFSGWLWFKKKLLCEL
jgi:hypothetical protein